MAFILSPHFLFSYQFLTVKHLWSHPVRASHHSVALLPVHPPEHSLFIGWFLRGRLHFVLDYKSGQSKVSYHHSVVLLARVNELNPNEEFNIDFAFEDLKGQCVIICWDADNMHGFY